MSLQIKNSRQGLLATVAPILMLALIEMPVYHVHLDRQRALTPDEIFREIKYTAEHLVKAHSALVVDPTFDVDERVKVLRYSLGGVKADWLGLSSDDPYRLPFARQLHIEALRLLFDRIAPDKDFWVKAVERSEQLVRETVDDIESTSDRAKLKERLDSKAKDLDDQLESLDKSIKLLAQGKGFKTVRIGTKGSNSDSFTVKIKKIPEDGHVQVLPRMMYIKCSVLNKCGGSWPWRVLLSDEEKMIGEYHYQAVWPGNHKDEGEFEVSSNKTLFFQPKE